MPFFVRDLGVHGEAEVAKWAGIVGAAAGVTMVLFSPLWGALADRYGRKPMVLRAMFGGAVALALMSLSRNVWQLTMLRLLQGALTGTVTASVALVASVAPRERSGYALGMMHVAVSLGSTVGPLLGGVVADHLGYRAGFLAAAVMLTAGGVLVALNAKEEFVPLRSLPKEQRGSFTEVFTSVGFLAAVFALLAVRFAYAAATPVFPLLVETIRGSTEGINTVTGSILAVGGVSAALSVAFLSQFIDAWGHRRILIIFCIFTAFIAMLHVPAGSITQLFLLRILFGIGAGATMPAANAIIRNVTHDRNIGKAFGITSSLTAAGWGVGPLAGGFVAASMGIRAPFVMMGLALLGAAAIVTWRVKAYDPTRPQSPNGN